MTGVGVRAAPRSVARHGGLVVVAAVGAIGCSERGPRPAPSDPVPTIARANDGGRAVAPGPAVVMVQLYTSQGCSSCPPAERLLAELPGLATGVEVVPLAFHVDYWDDLGWRDPFSAAAWTERQRRFAAATGGEVYTPELVVAGRTGLVGSEQAAALAAIVDAARIAPTVALSGTLERGADAWVVRVAARADAAIVARPIDVMVALRESGLETRIRAGENQGEQVREDFVVRRAERAVVLEHGAAEASVRLPVDSLADRAHADVVVWAEDRERRAVYGALRLR